MLVPLVPGLGLTVRVGWTVATWSTWPGPPTELTWLGNTTAGPGLACTVGLMEAVWGLV